MRHKALSICLLVLFLFAAPFSVSADGFDSSRKGSVSVTLTENSTQKAVAGAEIALYYVATVDLNSNGKLSYVYTDAFKNCGTALEDSSLPLMLDIFVQENYLTSIKQTTDSNGKAKFDNLPLGLYFVRQTGMVDGFAPCASFVVTVPFDTGEGFDYSVNASPKTSVQKLTDIVIRKVWNTDETTKVADSVTVQLLRDGKVVQTATLNEGNHWQICYANMPQSDSYSVKEINVPNGFTATYSQKGYEFTVTNSASLIHTGQLVWPIPILLVLGVFLIAAGAIMLLKAGKADG